MTSFFRRGTARKGTVINENCFVGHAYRKLLFLLIHAVIPEVLLLGWVLFFFVDKDAMDDILNDVLNQMNFPKWLKVPSVVSFLVLLQLNAGLAAIFAFSNKKIKKLNMEMSIR